MLLQAVSILMKYTWLARWGSPQARRTWNSDTVCFQLTLQNLWCSQSVSCYGSWFSLHVSTILELPLWCTWNSDTVSLRFDIIYIFWFILLFQNFDTNLFCVLALEDVFSLKIHLSSFLELHSRALDLKYENQHLRD